MNSSEFRQDPITKNWILIAPARFEYHRKHHFVKSKRIHAPIAKCPFEDPLTHVNEKIILKYPEEAIRDWKILVLENGFPVVRHSNKLARQFTRGGRILMKGVGHHDLVITRSHTRNFPKLTLKEAVQVFEAFRMRYLMLYEDRNVSHVAVFHNWGPLSGASVYHPHYQIIGIPVLPKELRKFENIPRCFHCNIIRKELADKRRIIYEDSHVLAFAPYASRRPFEVRIFPKRHLPYFENTSDDVMKSIVNALQKVLHKFEKKLSDPDYNFFIHTAPIRFKNQYKNYHWHIEILPSLGIRAGFEFESGIEINFASPEKVASILRIN